MDDNKEVYSMYTGYSPCDTSEVLRRDMTGTKMSVPCPTAIASYNKFMGGVDRGGDQLRSYYHRHHKCRKFYR